MKRMGWRAVAVCLALVGMIGCRGSGQVYQVKDAPVVAAFRESAQYGSGSKGNHRRRCRRGMANGSPEARRDCRYALNVRSHQAVVSIPYTAKAYSILYKDSSNLKYDEAAQTIHENYASWIQRLDGAIRSRLSAAGD